ncbi:MAG: MgtC/SapB family protein [Rhodocyclaceae bacterium]|jgi:putative Mg2+ transporter-C (MgtC) family protein|nr:MgtC/SapB family protein [Rhodocyclaceae bacterium]
MTLPDNQTLLSFWSQQSVEGNILLLMHLIGSMLLGMFVGYERSYHGRAAGMRTFSLVCMASTGIVAVFGMPDIWFGGQQVSAVTADGPSRVIQGIVTGIGFLGAGVIIHEGRSVSGLSTAASIWAAAAIGILIGLGFYLAGITLAFLCAFSMSIVLRLESWLPKHKRYYFELSYTAEARPDTEALLSLAASHGFNMRRDTVGLRVTKNHQVCSFTATSGPKNHVDTGGMVKILQGMPELERFSISPERN